ncbi:MAG: glycosyltransferase family 39 protein [Xanthomonadaceae bacterium]|nr:glycosyltransferase family 39 protein [Xanthomonadaceae bacterium]
MTASIGNPGSDGVPPRAQPWRSAFWIVWTILLAVKVVLAAQLAPFGDEAWYWQESRHLAWGYSDLPPLTAWMIAAGEAVFGHGVLAMRAPFLVLGALLPFVIVRIGRRVSGAADGWIAGLLVLALPLLGTLGIFALPDVPLTFVSALALDAVERAARTQRLRDWTLLGLALALAWLAHYRAAMLLAAGLAFFTLTPRGRTLWRDPGLWLALAILCLGIVPAIVFNATHAWAALDFQLVQRNPWRFHADALVQPLEQALVCTPLFYLMLLWALWRVVLKAVRPERSAEGAKSKGAGVSTSFAARTTLNANGSENAPWDLFACGAAVPIVAYFALGLFADDTHFRAHWPLPGYLPLLIVLPMLLRQSTIAAGFRITAFGMLAGGCLLAFAYLGMAAIPGGADFLSRMKAFPQQFVGWREAAAETRTLLAQPRFADSIVVADNFMLAAELDFALDGRRPVYSLDHPINGKHGRAPQLAIWGRDEAGLHALAGGHPVLLVVEPGARRERERAAWLDTLCSRVGNLAPIARLDAYDGRKRYRWYSGLVKASAEIKSNPDCITAKP